MIRPLRIVFHFLALLSLPGAFTVAAVESPPNIVLIFSDELDPSYLGIYGGDWPTPTLDALAADGVVFDRAFSVGAMCTPSRYSLLTGNYPGRCRAPVFLAENPRDDVYNIAWNTELTAVEPSMGRLFTDLGYQTGIVGKWHLSGDPYTIDVPEIAPDANVTDPVVQALLAERQALIEEHVRQVSGFEQARSVLWANFDNDGMLEVALRDHNYEWILNGALDFLDTVERDRPFLMVFASTSVHGPNHVKSLAADPRISPAGRIELPGDYYPSRERIQAELTEWSGRDSDDHISAGMIQLDYQVAGILQKLEERELDENTLVIFLADHGIEPGKATSYLRGGRIPFFATWLGQDEEGRRSDRIVQVPDVLPTILALAGGAPTGEDVARDGRSFAHELGGPLGESREFAYFENGFTRSILQGHWHYIAWRYPRRIVEALISGELSEAPDHLDTVDNGQASITMQLIPHYWDADQLFDVSSDPYEMNNLFGDPTHEQQVRKLKSQLRRVLMTFDHPFPLDATPLQSLPEFEAMKAPRLERGTDHIYWYTPGSIVWPPEGATN